MFFQQNALPKMLQILVVGILFIIREFHSHVSSRSGCDLLAAHVYFVQTRKNFQPAFILVIILLQTEMQDICPRRRASSALLAPKKKTKEKKKHH